MCIGERAEDKDGQEGKDRGPQPLENGKYKDVKKRKSASGGWCPARRGRFVLDTIVAVSGLGLGLGLFQGSQLGGSGVF